MSAPVIQLYDLGTMNVAKEDVTTPIDYKLFADSGQFSTWQDWVNDSANSPSANELSNAAVFSNYALKLKCTVEADNDACCIKHASKGAFCIHANSADIAASNDPTAVASNTASFTAEEWTTWSGATATLEGGDYDVSNTSINDPFFEFFYCGGSRDRIYTCYKYQRSTGINGDPRFDTDSGETAFYNYASGTLSSATNIDKLSGATARLTEAALALAATMLALSLN